MYLLENLFNPFIFPPREFTLEVTKQLNFELSGRFSFLLVFLSWIEEYNKSLRSERYQITKVFPST